MAPESLLNNYYNKGGYNKPSRIGYMMNMIRNLKPLTQEEWKIWYLENVHDEQYLDGLAQEMCEFIPAQHNVSLAECKHYIYDVMFRRTFNGYNRENQALTILRNNISPEVQEAPEDWDTQYFIDFYVYNSNHELIGIQLKPETFYLGRYQYKVDIQGKMESFCRDKGAKAFILKYSVASDKSEIIFTNSDVITEIKKCL